jgi:hypothetical protein
MIVVGGLLLLLAFPLLLASLVLSLFRTRRRLAGRFALGGLAALIVGPVIGIAALPEQTSNPADPAPRASDGASASTSNPGPAPAATRPTETAHSEEALRNAALERRIKQLEAEMEAEVQNRLRERVNAEAKAVAEARDRAAAEKARVQAAAQTQAARPVNVPATQARFLEIMRSARAMYQAGANDMAKGAARPARRQALCAAFSSGRVSGWVGRVSDLSTNGEGKGVLAIGLDDKTWVKTWNNALSDLSDRTLLEPSSPVFGQSVALRKAQRVTFSGELLRSETDCFRESSVTLHGSLTEPEFIFRFSDVRPLD